MQILHCFEYLPSELAEQKFKTVQNLHQRTAFLSGMFSFTIVHTKVGFASFFSGGFITAIVINPPERKLAKRIVAP